MGPTAATAAGRALVRTGCCRRQGCRIAGSADCAVVIPEHRDERAGAAAAIEQRTTSVPDGRFEAAARRRHVGCEEPTAVTHLNATTAATNVADELGYEFEVAKLLICNGRQSIKQRSKCALIIKQWDATKYQKQIISRKCKRHEQKRLIIVC